MANNLRMLDAACFLTWRAMKWLAPAALTLLLCCPAFAQPKGPVVRMGPGGELGYAKDPLGNRIPDFSSCGYGGGGVVIPDVPTRVVVSPGDGDDTGRIQRAIDRVSGLPLDDQGFRGAVRLAPGEFQVEGQLRIAASGVILRGSGAAEGGTVLHATGQDRRPLITLQGASGREFDPDSGPLEITDEYVPVGADGFDVNKANQLAVGDTVLVIRPSTEEWIREVRLGWKPRTVDLVWDRVITEVSGNRVTVDAPVTTALEKRLGGGTVHRYRWPERLERVGVEDISLVSDCDPEKPKDEDHAWYGVYADKLQDGWVRRVEFRHFAGGAVHLGLESKRVTVEDCLSLAPVSETGGYRRHTFFTLGQTTLFNRCWSELGMHDFCVGMCSAGPNVFLQCRAKSALGSSGPIETWASGVLYDNVRIEGNDLELVNRWDSPPRAGWSAANCVLWQCRAASAACFRPPGANNWAIGCWATPAGDGTLQSPSDFVRPFSLYQAQLASRIGGEAGARLEPLLGTPEGATNPTYEQAERFVERSRKPAIMLVDLIRENHRQSTGADTSIPPPLPAEAGAVKGGATGTAAGALRLSNGWLTVDGKVLTGGRLRPSWWRGTIQPFLAAAFGHNITRFVPGRFGLGLTEDLTEVANDLAEHGIASYEHHYGLWYDWRRGDHLMVRRANGEVAPPFYEQPFARSGEGTAWDGLSRYDLTEDNAWYWNRLHRFAQLCGERGMVLVHNNYFQHNIIEAGAHWVDCPWRPANNVNEVELPEPPPFIGDKRVFVAEHFYDVTRPNLRAMHRRYIRQCLDAFADCPNVMQSTSAEFTGPLEFVRFWIDTIVEWEREKSAEVLVTLACTKDVQDAILADPERSRHVDVIDIRYWMYDRNMKPYTPPGGRSLAPRQHLRQMRPEPASFESIAAAVTEYRGKFPDKAVLYNADVECRSGRDGWAVLIGGGSLAEVKLPVELAEAVAAMLPDGGLIVEGSGWCLASSDGQRLVYIGSTNRPVKISVAKPGPYRVRWLDERNGEVVADDKLTAGESIEIVPKTRAVWITPSG